MMAESKAILPKHVATEMLWNVDYNSNTGNSLHQYASTKSQHHYEGSQVTLQSGSPYQLNYARLQVVMGKHFNATKEMSADLAACIGVNCTIKCQTDTFY